MSLEFPSQKKSRNERLLGHTKAYATKIVQRIPSSLEGADGDIAVGVTVEGIKLFAKIGKKWHSFSPDSADTAESSKVVNFTPSADGTVAIPSKYLNSSDSGKTFVIDISTYTVVFKLPPVSQLGVNFKFVLAHASNNEALKDFAFITSATGEDVLGNIMVAGAVLEIAAVSTVQIDSDVGAATYGDWLSVFSDGSYWYIDGSTVTASSVVSNAGHSLAT